MHMQHAHAMQCNAVHPEYDPARYLPRPERAPLTSTSTRVPCRPCCHVLRRAAASCAVPRAMRCRCRMSVSVSVCRGRSERREGKEVRREDGIGDGIG
jgi:hypothetical protein